MRRQPVLLVLLEVLVLVELSLAQPALPGIPAQASQAVSQEIGLGKPAVVAPGGSFSFALSSDSGPLRGAYIVSVVLEDGKLKLLNYSVTLSYSAGRVTVSLPTGVRPALYDLFLVGQSTLEIPRSVWVIDPSKTTYRIVHITDQHYGAGQPDIITGDTNRLAGYLIASLLTPDFIIDTGDIADTVSEQYYRWATAYERAFLYSYPIFAIPGNHDTPSDAWSKYYGSTTWYRLIGDKALIVGLYTYESGYAPLPQLQWAEDVLKRFSSVPVKILLIHHPVLYYQGELRATYDDERVIYPYDPQKAPNSPVYSSWSGNMEATRYFLRLVEEYGVNFVFSGHVHRDLYVKYTSTRTGRTTYFITATTLGMGSAIYDGIGFYEVDMKTGAISFPLTPRTFIGFANDTRKLAQNSIPVGTYPPPNNLGVANQVFTPSALYQWPHAYVLTVENRLDFLSIENTAVWCLPWAGDFSLRVVESTGGAELEVVDSLNLAGRLYLAVRVKLPPGSRLVVALTNAPDTSPPEVGRVMLTPAEPQPGGRFQALIEVKDSGWGVSKFSASLVGGDSARPLEVELYAPGTLADPLSSLTYKVVGTLPSSGESKLVISATDFAGNEVRKEIVLVKAQEQPPAQPPSPPQAPPQTLPEAPSTPAEQPPPPSKSPAAPSHQPLLLAIAALVTVAAIILVAVALRSRKAK